MRYWHSIPLVRAYTIQPVAMRTIWWWFDMFPSCDEGLLVVLLAAARVPSSSCHRTMSEPNWATAYARAHAPAAEVDAGSRYGVKPAPDKPMNANRVEGGMIWSLAARLMFCNRQVRAAISVRR